MSNVLPAPHRDPFVELTRRYITEMVQRLAAGGLQVERSWLDPCDPRDATVVYAHPGPDVPAKRHALVWDEETGWRSGIFEGGHQGVRTTLSNAVYLGGGLLPAGEELSSRLLSGTSENRVEFRSAADRHDGFEDVLRGRR